MRASRFAFVLAVAAAAGCARTGPPPRIPLPTDNAPNVVEREERKTPLEGEIVFPSAPREADLILYRTAGASAFSFYVDTRSIDVQPGGIIRFTLVARSDSGGRNTSYEGLRCDTRERRTYGFLRPDNAWARSRAGDWQRMPAVDTGEIRGMLWRDIFCTGGVPVANVTEAVNALRIGVNPRSVTQ